MAAVTVRMTASVLLGGLLGGVLGGCTVDGRSPLGSPPSRLAGTEGDASASPSPSTTPEEAPEQAPAPEDPPADLEAEPGEQAADGSSDQASPDADLAAGVLEPIVPQSGPGTTTRAAGSVPAVAPGKPVRVRVEVEDGLAVDVDAFAAFVITTLQDPRGWVREGWSFSRTDGDADVVVTLATPDTSARMCAPLDTQGTLSCRVGDDVVITHYRWVNGADAYGEDRTSYRQYLVNHEVGHALGHGHVPCPGRGQLAPTMLQQTKGVGECVAQPWPYP